MIALKLREPYRICAQNLRNKKKNQAATSGGLGRVGQVSGGENAALIVSRENAQRQQRLWLTNSMPVLRRDRGGNRLLSRDGPSRIFLGSAIVRS